MRCIFASDSFKGTLSSFDTIRLLKKAAQEIFPDIDCVGIPLGDGGEGTIEAINEVLKAEIIHLKTYDPLFRVIDTYYLGYGDIAIIEMAKASGITLLDQKELSPSKTSTYGTGIMIKDAIDKGYKKIYLCLGGSATNDGGIGALRALGAKFYDQDDHELIGKGEDLIAIKKIDDKALKDLADIKIKLLSDVDNVLCGENGATYIFGRQKGASLKELESLEKGMVHYRDLIYQTFDADKSKEKGTGAAGGLGFGLVSFLKASFVSGIETILDIIGFDHYLKDADIVITGEGSLDHQSLNGKAISGIIKRAAKYEVPVIIICGKKEKDLKLPLNVKVYTTSDGLDYDYIKIHAQELYYKTALKVFEDLKTSS